MKFPVPELGHDNLRMVHDTCKPRDFDSPYQFLRPERSLARGAPDIDPFGIQNQNERIESSECRTQGIETQGIICRSKDRGFRGGVPEPVQAGLHAVPATVHAPAGEEMVEPVGDGNRAVSSPNLRW